jgi:CheY-like chemotaxis protein/DNA-binding XRE family transcriptional regulator
MELTSLGDKLRTARVSSGLTQTQVSGLLQIDKSTISKLESHNAINWTLYKLIQISSLYGKSLFSILLDGANYRAPLVKGGAIVLLEDESTQLHIFHAYLVSALPEVSVIPFYDPLEADEWLQSNRARVVITDYRMSPFNGGEIIKRLRRSDINQHTPAVLMTEVTEKAMIRQIARDENALFFDKHQPKATLIGMVTDILRIV